MSRKSKPKPRLKRSGMSTRLIYFVSLVVCVSSNWIYTLFSREKIKLEREKQRQEREEKIKSSYQKKIEEQERKRFSALKLIDRLESEELELLNRLKRTNEMQESAFENLQNSIRAWKKKDFIWVTILNKNIDRLNSC